MRANEFVLAENSIEEARRNNFGREISNVQGQALGKKLAAKDPNAQQALAQAKAAQQTNVGDMYGKGMDTLGISSPQQRLNAKKAAAAKYGDMAVDPDEVRTPQATSPATAAQAPGTAAPSKLQGAVNTAKNAASAAGTAISGIPQAMDRMAQSKLGQTLGGWSQRLVGVGSTNAAAQQIWNKKFYSMVNNLIANSKDSALPFSFGNAMSDYLTKQRIPVAPDVKNQIVAMGNKIQQGGFQRPEIVKLANTIWSIGSTAKSSNYGYQEKKMSDMTGKELQQALNGKQADATTEPTTAATPAATTPPATKPAAQSTTDAGANAFGSMANQLQQPKPTAKTNIPVGTKFLAKTKSGKQLKAEKTDTGWKVGGVMVTDPKGVADLEKQANSTTPPKPVAKQKPIATPPTKQQATVKATRPVRKLKTPSALSKGTPGKPAVAGKSRIRQ